MKKILAVFVLVFILQSEMIGQGVDIKFTETKKMAITIGLLNGGGLLGAELETLLSNKLGAHIGVGFVGACVGLNYHLKPTTNSSYFSLELRNQGIGEIYTDTSLGLGLYSDSKEFLPKLEEPTYSRLDQTLLKIGTLVLLYLRFRWGITLLFNYVNINVCRRKALRLYDW